MKNNFKGLTSEEAKSKLKEFGYNELVDANKISAFKILLRQVQKNFVIYLLFFAAIVSFALGKGITGYVIILVIAIVVTTGFVQEYKAEKAIGALKSMIMSVSRVFRNGKEKEIPSGEIVPGDILTLRTGEKIPADGVVLEEVDLKINESVLTGESTEVNKIATSSEAEFKDENLVFMGSFVVSGRCVVRVIHTGMNTKFGKIAGMISTAEKELPLQDKINKISKYMIGVGLSVATLTGIVLFARAEVVTPDVIINILIIVIALAVSSFPEGFPVVLITTLANGVNKMAKQNAVVNRMSIIETLGETSVICSDKTGTITKGEMTVRKVYTAEKLYDVTGVGYETVGEFLYKNEKVDISKNEALIKLLECSILCNDSNIERLGEDSLYKVIGSSTEGALLILAAKIRLFKENFKAHRIEELPFDSKRKMMSVLCSEGGVRTVYVKGAPEVILRNSVSMHTEKGIEKLTDVRRNEIIEANKNLTSDSFRSLAFAYKVEHIDKLIEDEFIFLGLVGMEDPPREEVAEAIALCKQGGIKVKIITGDHKETALAIAKQIGIVGDALTGEEMDDLSDDELRNIVGRIVVFARVKPEDKLRIVRALKANGEIVTMTGDGVNDAPALKEAHIGVAMGINGTDVSRSVADITLKDDNFATIVIAIKEGRSIFNNIRKFITYQLSCNLANISILFVGMIVAPFLGWYVPIITALQILFMNIVTDNIPAITLGLNKTSKDIMSEKPRKNAQLLTREFINLIIVNGLMMGAIAFCVAYISYNVLMLPPDVARTTVLISMVIMQIANAFSFRSFRYRVLNRRLWINKYLFFASILSITATILIVYTPLNKLLETTPLTPISWIIAISAGLAIVTLFDVMKIINNKTNIFLHHIH